MFFLIWREVLPCCSSAIPLSFLFPVQTALRISWLIPMPLPQNFLLFLIYRDDGVGIHSYGLFVLPPAPRFYHLVLREYTKPLWDVFQPAADGFTRRYLLYSLSKSFIKISCSCWIHQEARRPLSEASIEKSGSGLPSSIIPV